MTRKRKQQVARMLFVSFIVLVLVAFGNGVYEYWNDLQNEQVVSAQSDQTKEQFIASLVPVAKEEQQRYGVLASITLAQAALESDWGKSELSAKYNNLFGIKSTNGSLMTTKEYVDGQWITIKDTFAVYSSWDESVRAHTQLFVSGTDWNKAHYQTVLTATDYTQAAQALQDQGYATDPNYAQKLIALIKEYNLNQYDV